MVLLNLRWLVTEQHSCNPLLGGTVLEALGLSTAELLAAAADRFKIHSIWRASSVRLLKTRIDELHVSSTVFTHWQRRAT